MRNLLCALGIFGLLTSNAVAGDTGWHSVKKLNSEIRKLKKDNIMPTGMACRADPKKKIFKAQFKLTWRNGSNGTAWTVLAEKSQIDWRPTGKWKKIYKKNLIVGASGNKFRCSLWHKK